MLDPKRIEWTPNGEESYLYLSDLVLSASQAMVTNNHGHIFNVSDLSVIFVSIKSRKHLSWLFVQKDYYKQEE